MAGSYEKNIRWKAIGIYLFIAAICIAVSFFIYSLSGNVRNQKRHIENYSDLLKITNQVVFSVSEAQSTANVYLNSKNPAHLRSFRRKAAETESLLDSLAVLSRLTGDTTDLGNLMQIGSLLSQKGDIIYRLNTQLTSYNPVDSIEKLFIRDEPASAEDSTRLGRVVPEAFVPPRRANFWERVSGAFNPEPQRDTIPPLQSPAMAEEEPDSTVISPITIDYVRQISSGYSSNIRALERQINSLLVTDQEISAQIIEILNRFHRATMLSTIRHIEDSEDIIGRNYRYSFAGIVLSLLLITLFVVLIINDTNKGQQARTELERANRRISEIMHSRHRLLLSVSHDIKTPLNAILGYLELWKEGKSLEKGDIEVAEFSGKHINTLISNLLEFSSLEQGIARPSVQNFSLTTFCRETAGMIRPLAVKKGLELHTSFAFPSDLQVVADPMRLRQIVLNILSNAVKYTPEGSVNLEVTFKDGRINFTVADTGTGMSPEELERIYKPFHRGRGNSAMAEGHGFGMYVVRGLVELLDGHMDIRSTPGEGTTVRVEIPAPVSERTDAGGSKRLLFVDDDTVLLKILEGMAASLGHSAECVPDAVKVISGEVALTGFDMVITDMEMGRHKGTDVLAAVKEKAPGLAVVVMTGHHDLTADTAAEMGFDGYIAKPVSIATLFSMAGTDGSGTGPRSGPAPAGKEAVERDMQGETESLFDTFSANELREIVATFKTAAGDDMRNLRSALFRRDERKAKEICHRMLPLFRQFGSEECASILVAINGYRAGEGSKKEFWKNVSAFIEKGNRFLETL